MKKDRQKQRGITKRILISVGGLVGQIGLLGFTALFVWALQSRAMPALNVWHEPTLDGEFTADNANPQTTLKEYLDQEEQLFDALKKKITDRVKPSGGLKYSRYNTGGPQDPESRQPNWNRTYELIPEQIRGGALLLHGLTDSPYSLRRIGEIFHARGFYVLGLRVPGHGTIPGALTTIHWKDWVAASRIGARHVRGRVGPDLPFVIAGYSNGGALSVGYALDALADPDLPRPDRLILFSPEIGISKLSVIANSHKLLSFLPYFAQFKWLSIQPEYDPYKYNSFPKNAAQQAHDLTQQLQDQIKKSRDAGYFSDFPPVLTFLSWVDDTVITSATIHHFYDRLENENSELVVFDVNRLDDMVPFIPESDDAPLKAMENRTDMPYTFTVITNAGTDVQAMVQWTKSPRSHTFARTPLPFTWPSGVYSLAHVAIPFSPDDPVYGTGTNPDGTYRGIPIATLAPRGETGVLTVPMSQFMRLRHNPFFPYLEKRIIVEIEGLVK